ncbi:MAG: DUF418 domain-containing protein [Kordiimonadaceae bacterium]|nr:DUF418 domain-containing protein [Kordiimonadaceae bacterium]MBO6567219.1 DUF418 domain-containing protein [Kordiimonadaceae bacterium]MBO6963566.1 DUF418 domain-containing protein [Kordiimonadaceae bacterium]
MGNQPERIELLDIVRGVAVLGILLMNIRLFSEPGAAYFNPLAHGSHEGLNKLWFQFQFVFADQKFMAIFSMLFGASTAIICDGLARKDLPVFTTYAKRILGLFVIGLVHAYLLWPGDILVPYALGSVIPFIAKNWSWRLSGALGLALLSLGTLSSLGAYESISGAPPVIQAKLGETYWLPSTQQLAEEVAAYQDTYMDHWPLRAASAFEMQTSIFLSWGVWRIGGMMLLGLALYRVGFLQGKLSARFYGFTAIAALTAGFFLVANGLSANETNGWTFPYSFFLASVWNYWGSGLVAVGYIAMFGWLLKGTSFRFGFSAFANVGKAALTNYLLQSIICISIFYGFGGGLFGELERYQTVPIVLAVWAIQLWLSSWWFSKRPKGPIEAIWHRVTYARWLG